MVIYLLSLSFLAAVSTSSATETSQASFIVNQEVRISFLLFYVESNITNRRKQVELMG